MDREIVLQVAAMAQDAGSGETVPDWVNATDYTIWAQWFPGNTREAWRAQQRLGAYIDGLFRIYYRSDVSAELTRIQWDGKTFDVRPPMEVGRQVMLDVPVVARVA